jgi:hypothetical protein
MADFTIGINIRDDKIFITISIEDREAEIFSIEEAESFQEILGLQINLAKTLTHSESKPPRVLSYERDAASQFR